MIKIYYFIIHIIYYSTNIYLILLDL